MEASIGQIERRCCPVRRHGPPESCYRIWSSDSWHQKYPNTVIVSLVPDHSSGTRSTQNRFKCRTSAKPTQIKRYINVRLPLRLQFSKAYVQSKWKRSTRRSSRSLEATHTHTILWLATAVYHRFSFIMVGRIMLKCGKALHCGYSHLVLSIR